jgi:NAD(P)-dependent dehydrogenase (short-subunit alcohol dehydrogenase family)
MLAGTGCKLAPPAGNAEALAKIAAECRVAGAEVLEINARPSDEAACAEMVAQTVAAFGSLDTLAGGVGHEQAHQDR